MVTLTHIGGPTALVEFAGWRILTDPTFDPAGGKYRFGWGRGSTKTAGPAIAAAPADVLERFRRLPLGDPIDLTRPSDFSGLSRPDTVRA